MEHFHDRGCLFVLAESHIFPDFPPGKEKKEKSCNCLGTIKQFYPEQEIASRNEYELQKTLTVKKISYPRTSHKLNWTVKEFQSLIGKRPLAFVHRTDEMRIETGT